MNISVFFLSVLVIRVITVWQHNKKGPKPSTKLQKSKLTRVYIENNPKLDDWKIRKSPCSKEFFPRSLYYQLLKKGENGGSPVQSRGWTTMSKPKALCPEGTAKYQNGSIFPSLILPRNYTYHDYIELWAKLLDYFLRSNKSNINQSKCN